MNTDLPGPASDLEKIAISKAISDKTVKEFSAKLPPGKYRVDATVRVFGDLTKGTEFSMNCPMVLPFELMAMLAANRLNPNSCKKFEEDMHSLLAEAEGIWERDPKAMEQALADIKPHVKDMFIRIHAKTNRTVTGRLTTKLNTVVIARGESGAIGVDGHVTEIVNVPPGTIPKSNRKVPEDDVPAELSS